MTTEFDAIFGDFSEELDAISDMADAGSRLGPETSTARARIAAGNGATLLLAATFEEYVRQQVRAAFVEKARRAKSMKDFPPKIASTVWKRSLEALARTPFEEIETDGGRANGRVAATLSFCLRKELTADVADILAHNDYNMRPGELGRLFNQIGMTSIISRACEDEELVDFLGADTPGKATALLESRLEQFFRRRNEIAHAIKLGSASGPTELHQDVDLFRAFGRALSVAIQRVMDLGAAPNPDDVSAAAN